MNLYETLHKDHEKVAEIFGLLEGTRESEGVRRDMLFATLNKELDIHSQAEEKYFYSRLKVEEGDTRELVLESLDDHKELKKHMDELDSMDKGTVEWTAKLRICRGLVESHVTEEENELFPRARKILGEEGAFDILQDIEAFKEEHLETH